jgi:hypothetical protein
MRTMGGKEGGGWHWLGWKWWKSREDKKPGKKQRWQNGGMNYGMEWTRKKTTG